MEAVDPKGEIRGLGRGENRLPREDLAALRMWIQKNRLGADRRRYPEYRISDIAEATGVPADEINEALRVLRSEKALSAFGAEKKAFPFVHVAAVMAILLGIRVSWILVEPRLLLAPAVRVHPRDLQISSTTDVRSHPSVGTVGGEMLQHGAGDPPPGFRVVVTGPSGSFIGDGMVPKVNPIPYEEDRDGLISAAEKLVKVAQKRNLMGKPIVSGLIRDETGSAFEIKPGEVHFSFDGWSGSEHGTLQVPLTAAGRMQIRKAAVDILAEEKATQDDALNLTVSPKEGIVLPPPSYTIQFAGRRTEVQVGPRIAFLVPDPSVFTKQLTLAIENAVIRDGKPPVGVWTRSAAEEAKIPFPETSRVTVTDREANQCTFDVPTSGGWSGAARNVVERQIEPFVAKSYREMTRQ